MGCVRCLKAITESLKYTVYKRNIRQDKAATYPDGGKQDRHYNSGNAKDDKLKQHHYYKNPK